MLNDKMKILEDICKCDGSAWVCQEGVQPVGLCRLEKTLVLPGNLPFMIHVFTNTHLGFFIFEISDPYNNLARGDC